MVGSDAQVQHVIRQANLLKHGAARTKGPEYTTLHPHMLYLVIILFNLICLFTLCSSQNGDHIVQAAVAYEYKSCQHEATLVHHYLAQQLYMSADMILDTAKSHN